MNAEAYFSSLPQSRIELGLDRVAEACAALGNPQSRYESILVAGTNGKGSVCAYLASILEDRRPGVYTSPHLERMNERIVVGGESIDDATLCRSLDRLLEAYPPARDGGLTYFEAMTVLAFDVFAQRGVELAILEVGLGGRLDATNVPGTRLLASVISRLGLDHTEYLGPTLADVAREKAGIVREGVPCVTAPLPPAARRAIEAVCSERGAKLFEAGRDFTLTPGEGGLEYRDERLHVEGLRPGLLGGHQAENAAVALAAISAAGLSVGDESLRHGLSAARWPGRLEVVAERPLVILDGAHNPDGAAALADAFPQIAPGRRPQIVFGLLADKERELMMETLLPLAAKVHICAPDSPRSVPVLQLAREAAGHSPAVQAHESPEAALEAARSEAGEDGVVLVCGSLYLVGQLRARLLARP